MFLIRFTAKYLIAIYGKWQAVIQKHTNNACGHDCSSYVSAFEMYKTYVVFWGGDSSTRETFD